MIFENEDVVYCVPIRFWEDKDPIKCIVKQEKKTDHFNVMESTRDSIYVYSELHGHNVYVNRKHLFFSEKQCREAIELYSKLHEVYHHDETVKIMDRIFGDVALKAE